VSFYKEKKTLTFIYFLKKELQKIRMMSNYAFFVILFYVFASPCVEDNDKLCAHHHFPFLEKKIIFEKKKG
jgi:hypothetical protein